MKQSDLSRAQYTYILGGAALMLSLSMGMRQSFGLLQPHVVRDLDPSMGAEDFAFMLDKRPGAYFRIGQGGAESGCFLHNPRYDFNDEILPLGAALFVRLAERSLPL